MVMARSSLVKVALNKKNRVIVKRGNNIYSNILHFFMGSIGLPARKMSAGQKGLMGVIKPFSAELNYFLRWIWC